MGFRIPWAIFQTPKPRISESPTQISPDSEFHKQKYPGFRYLLQEATCWKNNLKDGYPIPGRERTRVYDSREARSFLGEFPKILSDVGFYRVKGWEKLSLLWVLNRGSKGVYNTVKEVGYNICKHRQRGAGNENRTLWNQQLLPLQLRSANLILSNAV